MISVTLIIFDACTAHLLQISQSYWRHDQTGWYPDIDHLRYTSNNLKVAYVLNYIGFNKAWLRDQEMFKRLMVVQEPAMGQVSGMMDNAIKTNSELATMINSEQQFLIHILALPLIHK